MHVCDLRIIGSSCRDARGTFGAIYRAWGSKWLCPCRTEPSQPYQHSTKERSLSPDRQEAKAAERAGGRALHGLCANVANDLLTGG